jgi:hypothetical protein
MSATVAVRRIEGGYMAADCYACGWHGQTEIQGGPSLNGWSGYFRHLTSIRDALQQHSEPTELPCVQCGEAIPVGAWYMHTLACNVAHDLDGVR